MSATMSDRADRIIQARDVRLEDELGRRGVRLKRVGTELVGPCPVCGGTDRFSINPRKGLWNCRFAGRGGDVIALVQYLDGCSFLEAVERLAGEGTSTQGPSPLPSPRARGEGGRRPGEGDGDNEFRRQEIARARAMWEAAGRHPGSTAESYLALRGVTAPKGAKLRGAEAAPRWEKMEAGSSGQARGWRRIYEGPALIAAICGNDGRFQGVQVTWIDLHRGPKYRAEIVHPQTGEILAAKIVRGSSRGGHIHLGGPAGGPAGAPRRLVVGEGTETVLSALVAELAMDKSVLDFTAYWASVGLQNLGGKAAATVAHPSLTRVDKAGRQRPLRVPGPLPDFDDPRAALMPPASATEIVLLGDGDSDRFTVEMAHARGAVRWARPGRVVRTAWADEGGDFNTMLRGAA
jgi:hypothetical protein